MSFLSFYDFYCARHSTEWFPQTSLILIILSVFLFVLRENVYFLFIPGACVFKRCLSCNVANRRSDAIEPIRHKNMSVWVSQRYPWVPRKASVSLGLESDAAHSRISYNAEKARGTAREKKPAIFPFGPVRFWR